ncbi:bacteriocin BlpO [Streptococcus pneumoniae]|nr:bacteriocin BlpO [Streptococcus pneumoniae]
MNTKMMSQFSVMDNEMLASIEGGTDWGTVGKGAFHLKPPLNV